MRVMLTLFALLLIGKLGAQEDWNCKDEAHIVEMEARAHTDLLQFRTNPYTDNYDLKYHRLEWTVDPRVYYIKGTVTAYFVPMEANFKEIHFELSKSLTVNQVRYHGQNVSFTQTNDDRVQIVLPVVIANGQLDSLAITYEGTPPRTGFGSFSQTFHSNTPIIWTLSEPYGSKDWWPSKMDLGDKIDSIDVLVKTPQQYRVASNGVLVAETQQDTFKTYHWKHRYPITTYLIAIGVTNYAVYSDYIRLPEGDTLEILNYVYPEQLNSIRRQTYRTVQSMELYNNLFGTYPFAKEKYGHAQFGFGGGEEHQTMSFMGGFSHLLQAHELAHQWFGDKVTCGSWRDIWLNEGFATYLEGLTQEAGIGTMDFKTWVRNKIASVTSQSGGSVWVDDTTSVNRIFNGRLSYDKGAMLLHMLRCSQLTPSDFYNAIRNYINDPKLAHGYAKTEDLKRHLEAQSGQDLTEFFEDWFYGQGYPSYQIEWEQDANQMVNLKINQTTSHPSVDFFEMKVPIQLRSENGEIANLSLNHQFSGQVFSEFISTKVVEVIFDPDLCIVSAKNQVRQKTTAANEIQHLASQILLYPNPLVQSELNIDLKNFSAKVLEAGIFDTKGSLVKQINIVNNLEIVDVSNIFSGIYILKLQTDKGAVGKTFIKQ